MVKKKGSTTNQKDLNLWEKAMQEFTFWKQAQGLRERTLDDYRKHIKMFFNRYPHVADLKNLKPAVYEYMGQDIKPATYNLRLIYLRTFFKWCQEEGYIEKNPLNGFKRKKTDDRIVKIDEETLKKLISLPDQKTFAGLRDYGIILLTLDSGIRPKEAFSLIVDDINFSAMEVYIRSEVSKTKISRTLPISIITATTLKEIILSRHPLWNDKVPIFCTTNGNPMDSSMWNDRLELYCKKLELKIRPYDLRHVFATMYLKKGGHAFSLQKILGHSDMQMTKRYVSLTEQDLKEQHTFASPINSLVPTKHRVRKIRN